MNLNIELEIDAGGSTPAVVAEFETINEKVLRAVLTNLERQRAGNVEQVLRKAVDHILASANRGIYSGLDCTSSQKSMVEKARAILQSVLEEVQAHPNTTFRTYMG